MHVSQPDQTYMYLTRHPPRILTKPWPSSPVFIYRLECDPYMPKGTQHPTVCYEESDVGNRNQWNRIDVLLGGEETEGERKDQKQPGYLQSSIPDIPLFSQPYPGSLE